jgi:hypothetical protein
MIRYLIGDRAALNRTIRKYNKSAYDRLYTSEVAYAAGTGSYNLFRPTSNLFHLIEGGDPLNPQFIEALHAYCTVEDISLPRMFGGEQAPKLDKRIPVVIFIESEDEIADVLRDYADIEKIQV